MDNRIGNVAVQDFGKAVLIALVAGVMIGGFIGYAIGSGGEHAAFERGVKAEQQAIVLEMVGNQPCINALHICYTEIEQGSITAGKAAMAAPK